MGFPSDQTSPAGCCLWSWLVHPRTPAQNKRGQPNKNGLSSNVAEQIESHLDENARLVVGVGGEGLRLFSGDGGVPLDEHGHDSTCGLDAQRQRGHIQQQQVLDVLGLVTAQDGCLDGCGTNG